DRRERSTLQPSSPVEHLGEAIAQLAQRLHAATYELLVMLCAFDEQAGWNNGFLSCAHWLSWRTGIDLGAAREKVRVAKALERLPRLSGAMQRGEISYAKARALSRIATPENEPRLLDLAYTGTAGHVERVVRAWRQCDRVEEARDTERRHLGRSVSTWVDDDGTVILRARLTPELGAVVQRALDAANARLYEESRHAAPPDSVAEEITPAQRRADALGLLAESALASGLDRGAAADRYQVVLHVEAEPATAFSAGDGPAQAAIELEDGAVRVSAETSRRLACDASVVVIEEGPEGSALDVGRKTRSIPPAIRRALNARDGRCRFPGCTARHCDAHHITHWADGGGTSLDNLLLLCRRHHRLAHEGGIGIERGTSGAVTFLRPDGRRIEMAPRLALIDLPALAAVAGSHGLPCWDGTRVNIGYAIDVLRLPPRSTAPLPTTD
ncbi:MAG TPA: DUF222 domain-containing protein, partial [Vicinamibacterales bacterium]|nr:DUF222 domain-containing protein [Vicinamibacterales bacterium]